MTEWLERKEAGGQMAVRLMRNVALLIGRRVAHLLVYPVALYFLVRRTDERRASREYLTRALGRPAGFSDLLRHFSCFTTVTLDRIFLLTGHFAGFDCRTTGLSELDAAIAMGRGTLLVGAHLGSFEALRILSVQRPEVPVRVVIDTAQNAALSDMLNALNPAFAASIIHPRDDAIGTLLRIREALESGALVAIMGDRYRPGNAVASVEFLGAAATLPTTPWQIAATLGVPVMLCFGLYRGRNRYDLVFEKFADEIRLDRRQRRQELAALVQRFADRLAHYARGAPYNWFNLYAFWTTRGEPVDHSPLPAASDRVV